MRGSTSLEHSARLLIEFQAPSVPSHVILNCNLRLEVRDHVPAPLRCRNCWTFGHHERACDAEERCGNCGQVGHQDGNCKSSPCCPACSMNHHVTSTNCAVWRKEMSINVVRVRQKTSSAKARRIIESPAPRASQRQTVAAPSATQYTSYAAAAGYPSQPPATPCEPVPAPASSSFNLQQFESIIARQLCLLETLVEQNNTIVQQNSQIIKLLSAPKLKQTTITPVRSKPTSSAQNKRIAVESPPKQGSTSPPSKDIQAIKRLRSANQPATPT